MSFASDLRHIAKKRNLSLRKISQTVPLRVFGAVVKDTRVDTGRMRGNWQVSGGSPLLTEIERKDPRLGAGMLPSEVAKVAPFALTYMTNNLPYAAVWEEKDAMIGRAVADFKRIVKEEAKKA